ncbi:hypothetical protein ACNOYE_30120 [Nannocystaceae bacterium ST9]
MTRAWFCSLLLLACQPGEHARQAPPDDEPTMPTPPATPEPRFDLADLECEQWACTWLVRVEADGRPSRALSTAPSRLGRLAVDDECLVWSESISFSIVRRARLDTLEVFGPDLGAGSAKHPEDLLVVGGRIFAADELGVHEWQAERRWRTIAGGDSLALAIVDEGLIRTRRPGGPTGVIERWPLAGGDSRVLAADEHRPGDLAASELGLVWLDAGQDQPGRVRLQRPDGRVRTIADAEQGPLRVAAGASVIAWIDRGPDARVVRAWADDRIETLASMPDARWRQGSRESVALRGDTVLWSRSDAVVSGTIGGASREEIVLPSNASLIDFALAGDALILAIEFAGPEPIRPD